MAFPLHTDDIVLVGPIYALSASTAINTTASEGLNPISDVTCGSTHPNADRRSGCFAGAEMFVQISWEVRLRA
jgi:hypothetical protein